ncbi:CD276 antigen-like [Mustelus asterias]
MVATYPGLILSLLLSTGISQAEAIVCEAKDQVVGAREGGEASLPCYFKNVTAPKELLVSWQLDLGNESIVVLAEYQNGTRSESQSQSFANRTSLPPSWNQSGTATLKIARVRAEDSGNYTCFVRDGGRHRRCAHLKLSVNSGASQPHGGPLCATILFLFLTKVPT